MTTEAVDDYCPRCKIHHAPSPCEPKDYLIDYLMHPKKYRDETDRPASDSAPSEGWEVVGWRCTVHVGSGPMPNRCCENAYPLVRQSDADQAVLTSENALELTNLKLAEAEVKAKVWRGKYDLEISHNYSARVDDYEERICKWASTVAGLKDKLAEAEARAKIDMTALLEFEKELANQIIKCNKSDSRYRTLVEKMDAWLMRIGDRDSDKYVELEPKGHESEEWIALRTLIDREGEK